MRAKPAALAVVSLMLCAYRGCSKDNSPKDLVRENTKDYDKMADLLAKIKDQASFEEVKPELKRIADGRRERLTKNMKRVEKMSAEEQAQYKKEAEDLKSSPEGEKFKEAVTRYSKEQVRIMTELQDVFQRIQSECGTP